MRHFDQLSFKEAALVLDIKETTATVRYHRALKKLRELWTRLHPEEDR
jgi:DNA-directed RNA polymerase specialized sigma24 family protein